MNDQRSVTFTFKVVPIDLALENENFNSALYLVAAAGNLETVEIIVKKNRDLLKIPGAGGQMLPLYAAALFGHYDVVNYLFKESNNLCDEDGWNPHNRGWLVEKCVENDMFTPMIHRHSFESLDRTFRDILKNNIPFGGKVIVFGGDFSLILPVVPGGSKSEIVNASLITSSYIWQYCTVLKLTINMRLQQGSNRKQQQEIKEFADWILKVGNGHLCEPNDGEVDIPIPEDLLINSDQDPVSDIIKCIYRDYIARFYEKNYFEDRAILEPTHEIVNLINDRMLNTLPGTERVYLSSDTICQADLNPNMSADLYSPDFLNRIRISGLPNHKLTLREGAPVMLLRNVDQQQGLCSGTRLQVKRLCEHVIEAIVISGSHVGHITYIPRMKLTSSDKKMLFQFRRQQFPLSVCFAMTINKSQGQSLGMVGLYLPKPVFTHGQLYVALSRIKSRQGLKVLICDEEGHPTNHMTNVVYEEVLQGL